jgi:probable HAF family extracellular repeat protein
MKIRSETSWDQQIQDLEEAKMKFSMKYAAPGALLLGQMHRCTNHRRPALSYVNRKSKPSVWITLIGLLAVLAMPLGLVAQTATKHHIYKVIDVGTFGGLNSVFSSDIHGLNAYGVLIGGAETPDPNPDPGCFTIFGADCSVVHAFRSHDGVTTDLGVLSGGSNSFPFGINTWGWVVGASEDGVIDPVIGIPEFFAVLWRDGQIKNLGTLGGDESVAADVNDRGQITGFSANTVPDPFSLLGFATQTRPFLWEHGVMRELDTLGGPDGAAYMINEWGQIIGQFSLNSTPNPTTGLPTVHSILWEPNGKPVDLGTLGGTSGIPYWINNRGQVVGQANLPGDSTYHGYSWEKGVLTDLSTLGGNYSVAWNVNDAGQVVGRADIPNGPCQDPYCVHHAFLWQHGVMTDLGTTSGDPCATAFFVNSQGQIVGDGGPCGVGGRAWLWENGGPILDLNTLAIPGSGLHLADADFINDRGEIACTGFLPNGDRHAVILVPQGECDDACEARVEASHINPAAIPVRAMTSSLNATQRARLGRKYHLPTSERDN